MLLRFRVANHKSIRDEQTLSLVGVPRRGEAGERRVVRVAGIYGANASGKSNVLDALGWMSWAVGQSHSSWEPDGGVPRRPFKLADAGPSFFELDFVHEDIRYSYGFEVDDVQVAGEWLYTFPHGRPKRLFERTGPEKIVFGRSLTGELRQIQRMMRPNSLYLSVAAANNHPLLSAIRGALSVHIRFTWRGDAHETRRLRMVKQLLTHPEIVPILDRLIRIADLGAAGIELKDAVLSDGVRKALETLNERAILDELEKEIVLRRASGMAFTLSEESAGTRAWLSLLGETLAVLHGGAVLVADEIDSSLHPVLSSTLIRMFKDPVVNRSGAQLIFASHDTTLLGNLLEQEILSRDEVWFTEKDDTGATSLFSLAEFHPRRDENVERGYLQGRYGAVPYVNFDQVRQLFEEGAA